MNRSFYLEGSGRQSVYESIRGASGSTVIENLQSQLKLRQGEISQLLVGHSCSFLINYFVLSYCCIPTFIFVIVYN